MKLTEVDQYEPLSQQVYDDLTREIDKLFDDLKNSMSIILDLNYEWQRILTKNTNILSESYTPMPISLIAEGKKLIKNLQYDLREHANTIFKVNKLLDLYRDKFHALTKKTIFRPKSTDQIEKEKLAAERADFEKQKQAWEAEKTKHAAPPTPVNKPVAEKPLDASPDAQDLKLVKLGNVLLNIMRLAGNRQPVGPEQVEQHLKKHNFSTIDDIPDSTIDHLDEKTKDKYKKAAEEYFLIYGNVNNTGNVGTGGKPFVPPPEA
jgi:hypothetical protein